MTDAEIIKAIAELDEIIEPHPPTVGYPGWWGLLKSDRTRVGIPNYLTSRDAIIPVIEKQPDHIKQQVWLLICELMQSQWSYLATPSQLSEALLGATGKWKE